MLEFLDDKPVIVRDLVRHYAGRAVIRGVDFSAEWGQVTAILGPNGAGKTTTVECCEGLRRPDAGTVRVLGQDPTRGKAIHRAQVGVMIQDGGLPHGVRSMDVLRHVARLYSSPLPITHLANRLGLDETARTPVRRLSGGQRQRLALACAVVGRPRVLFLDEPSAGMDPQTRRASWDLIRELRTEGVAIVLTTHLMDEAEHLADDVIVMHEGRIVARGTPVELTGTRSRADTVRFHTRPGLPLSTLKTALPTQAQIEEKTPGEYLVSGRIDPQVIATVTAWCAAQDVMPEGLSVGRRSLEDVFLDLTGHSLR
ncbi:MAG: ABC transporter ATP-binding protein [Actinomycetota bacterium]